MFESLLQKFAKPAPGQHSVPQSASVPEVHTPAPEPSPLAPSVAFPSIRQVDQCITLQDFNIQMEVILDPAQAEALIQSLKGCRVGLDIKTYRRELFATIQEAILSPHLAHVRTVQLYDGGNISYVIDVRHTGEKCLAGLSDTLPGSSLFQVGRSLEPLTTSG